MRHNSGSLEQTVAIAPLEMSHIECRPAPLPTPPRGKFCFLSKIDNLWRKIFLAFAHMREQMLTERGIPPA